METSAKAARFDLILTILGAAGFILAIAWIVGSQLEFNDVIARNPIPESLGVVARIPAALFLITGMNGIHGAQKARSGAIGRAAYLTTIVGLVLFAVVVSSVWVVGWLILHVGAVLFGLAVLRAGVLSRGAGFLLLIGVPLGFVGGVVVQRVFFGDTSGWGVFLGTAVMTVGFAWLAASAARLTGESARDVPEALPRCVGGSGE